ncbi:MAG: crotonase/enoyl-CoA hydratase family protein [Pseudomonadota bacterium]
MIDLTTDARGVATLTLNRPEKHNALSQAMIDGLTEVSGHIASDMSIRVVVLVGAGATFCAGGDLGWMRDQIANDEAAKRAAAGSLAGMLGALNDLPQPLIGRVHGNAFGGGVGLMSICDVVVAVETARFGLTETKLGLIPATIGPYVTARIGAATARDLFTSSRIFDVQEAYRHKLVSRITTEDALDQAVTETVLPFLDCAPGAVAVAKTFAQSLAPPIDDSVIAASIDALIRQWGSPEAKEGISAFFERRKPSWAVENP